MAKKEEKLIIIDGHALLHRAWHALPPLRTKDGTMVNAVYGFTSILLKIIKEFEPEYIACTFDLKGPTFRHEEFGDYKAQREAPPEEFIDQIDLVYDVLDVFNIPIYTAEGYEADDVIGTLVSKMNKTKPELKCIIVTGDMDALQLVNKNNSVFTIRRGITDTITYDEAAVKERYGFGPRQVIDYKALRGDPSDNIPGVKGIGDKGATDMIKEFGNLDNIYKALDKTDKISDRNKQLLKEQKEQAYQSYKLATIVTNVKIDVSLKDMKTTGFDPEEVYKAFQRFEFKSLLTKIPTKLAKGNKTKDTEEYASISQSKMSSGYNLINTEKQFNTFLAELKKQPVFAFDTETSSLDPLTCELLGISFCWETGTAYYLDIKNNKAWLKKLEPIFTDNKIKKIGHNIKYDYKVLKVAGIDTNNLFFDTMLAGYLLLPPTRSLKLDDLAFSEFGYKMQPITDLIGPKGKKQLSMVDIDISKVSPYACEDADYTWRLYKVFYDQIREEKMFDLLKDIEMPLVKVLANMELTGIKIDEKFLNSMNKDLTKRIKSIEQKIYKLAGEEFNVASPKQLKEILFEKLNVSTAGLKKTKTGFSTDAAQLEKMKGLHPIIDLISDFREYSKLKNTYLDALPELINSKTGRVHTSYNQAVTATGRLSSSDPNLQNIPIRTDLGREIRKGFITRPGYKLIGADYSQVELRIISSLADDPKMSASFKKGEDIHRRTAAEINHIDIKDVSFEQRYQAKAINFGIIYGLGSTGLAKSTDLNRTEAKQFIDNYLELYKKIKQYLDATKEFAHENGYVETLFKRRRYLPDINSRIPFMQAAAERTAINMPVQGTAADIMKLAMIKIWEELPSISPNSKLLLQVHDEVVVEAPDKDVRKVTKFIQETMENIYKLKVPIKVDIASGNNWGELK
ncbi:MAG: DNA polymerase I [Candidatus Komeilibacteria bacterium]